MSNRQKKIKILLIGPAKGGKTRISNYLADLNLTLPDDVAFTKPLRIVEYEQKNVPLKNGTAGDVDVELWDSCGEDKYTIYWSAYKKHADGIVFVYDEEDDTSVKKLDVLFNYFVAQSEFGLRRCLICCMPSQDVNYTTRLSSAFSKISQLNVNLETSGDKFKSDFAKFVGNLVKI